MARSAMPRDLEIAQSTELRPVDEVAAALGLAAGEWQPYGAEMGKIELSVLDRARRRSANPRLILVSAMTPTPAGEGKTTTSIGLAQGLARLGQSTCLALREPSLGPCLGRKGGGTGGGYCQVLPADRINLHFTGDFHAITSAHNLLSALIDNHLFHGNPLGLDPRRILWRRVLDLNDRALRDCVIGLGGTGQGVPRQAGFDITAASEVMAMFCLARDPSDLRRRLDRTLVALTYDGEPITAHKLKASGAMLALLKEAVKPNLVQTVEGVPTLIHGGPFANIAHGCNSAIATRMALQLADWVVTEAGFGFDLGAEKFFDIKCRSAGLDAALVVLVATVRALKFQAGVSLAELDVTDAQAVENGLPNLEKHIENIRLFGKSPVVAINRFFGDAEEEIEVVRHRAEELGVPLAVSDHYAQGGEGALELAQTVMSQAEPEPEPFRPLYALDESVPAKILAVARHMYGAQEVQMTRMAKRDLEEVRRLGYEDLPICIAKTPSSLSDDSKLRGRPQNFDVTIRRIEINSGAGFLVVLTGDVLRMPGLPSTPLAESLDIRDGYIVGLQ